MSAWLQSNVMVFAMYRLTLKKYFPSLTNKTPLLFSTVTPSFRGKKTTNIELRDSLVTRFVSHQFTDSVGLEA